MKFWKKKLTKKEKGFTLVELLVAIGIMGILAAVTVPSITHFMNTGKKGAQNAELATVQAAMNGMMAEKGIDIVPAVATATNDMSQFPPVTEGSLSVPITDYINNLTDGKTKYYYTCTDNGVVSVGEAPAAP